MALWTAFTLGLLGSLHCVGMCGPIAMALPLSSRERAKIVWQSLLYNLGRISTYALLGLFMGLMGWGIMLTGYQKLFSIILGAMLILSALFSFSLEQKLLQNSWMQKGFNRVKNKLGSLLKISSSSSAYQIGLLNGILPCGLVYIALAGAVTSGTVLNGAMYMAAFGSGTIPMLLGVMVFANLKKNKLVQFRRWIPAGLFLFGLLLIYRGLVMDIPADLSFWEATNFQIMCH